MAFPTSLENSTINVHDVDSTKRHMLGTALRLPDGRAFRYAKAGGALTIGRGIGHAAKAAGLASDGLASGAAGRTTAEWDSGTRTFHVATTASASTALHISADQFDDGYLWINDVDGEGQLLQIKSHGVSTTSATTSVEITMYDEELLTVALTTASQWGLTENMYSNVVVHTGLAAGGPALGVAPRAVASGKYFWLQTWGPCPVIADAESLVAGENVCLGNATGTTVPGAAYPQNSTEGNRDYMNPRLGFSITPQTGGDEYALVYLTCAV